MYFIKPEMEEEFTDIKVTHSLIVNRCCLVSSASSTQLGSSIHSIDTELYGKADFGLRYAHIILNLNPLRLQYSGGEGQKIQHIWIALQLQVVLHYFACSQFKWVSGLNRISGGKSFQKISLP